MARRSRIPAAAALLSLSLAVPALAQTSSFSLSWQAPAECPDEAHVRRAVEQLLGEGPPPPAHVSAHAVVEQTASGTWNVRLTTVRDGATGERVVESESCQSLADATALIVALTIDPERVAARAPGVSPAGPMAGAPSATPSATATPTATPTPTATATATATPSPNPNPNPTPRSRTLVALFAQVGGDVGTLPSVALSLGGGAALTLGSFRVEGYGTYLTPQAAHAVSPPSLGSNIHLLTGGLRGCFVPSLGRVELGGCGGLELGDLHGEGFGPPHSPLLPYSNFVASSGGELWAAATLSGRVSWRIARSFALVVDAGMVVPFQRQPFVIDNLGVLHQPGLVEGRAWIGPEVRF